MENKNNYKCTLLALLFVCNTSWAIDTDGDGISDATEIALGSDPNISETSILFEHLDNNDPVTESWLDNTTLLVTTSPVTNDNGFDAWQIRDGAVFSPSTGGYLREVTTPPLYGWALSFRTRVSDFFISPVLQNSSNYITYSTSDTRYSLALVADSSGLPAGDVTVFTGDSRSHTLAGLGSTYHLYEIIFSPYTETSQVYLNGNLAFDNYDGDGVNTSRAEVFFGSAQTASQGEARYQKVQFVTFDASADRDSDGLTEAEELSNSTNPLAADTDADGLSDGDEINTYATDPLNPDSDNDGVNDGDEINIYNSNPLVTDSDGDSIPDGIEVLNSMNPASSDSDGDGLLDRQELGQGTFGTASVIASGDLVNTVLANRIDSDDDIDIVAAVQNDQKIVWFENTNGSGLYGIENNVDANDTPSSIFATDIDGDNDTDLIGAFFSDKISWFENLDSEGSFGNETTISTSLTDPEALFSSDIDGDGDRDVVYTSWIPAAIFWQENLDGLGNFGAQKTISNNLNQPQSVYVTDIDGDGDQDVLSASSGDTKIAWYENTNSLGVFGTQRIIATDATSAYWVHAADIDGDNDQDVLAAGSNGSIVWYENTDGLGNFSAENIISTTSISAESLFTDDIDGDGDQDVLSVGSDGNATWYENTDGNGSFGSENTIYLSASPAALSIITEDIDRDGDPDAIIGSLDDVVWLGNVNVANPTDPDSDDDGLLDGTEVNVYGTDPLNHDTDNDGLEDDEELNIHNTNPLNSDTDNDGLLDGEEVDSIGTDPLDNDTDNDGLYDDFEVSFGFNPLISGEQTQDPDGDNLNNLEEQAANSNPTLADSDFDGLTDGEEVNIYTTNPVLVDTDADNVSDGTEVLAGSNPTTSESSVLASHQGDNDPTSEAWIQISGVSEFGIQDLGLDVWCANALFGGSTPPQYNIAVTNPTYGWALSVRARPRAPLVDPASAVGTASIYYSTGTSRLSLDLLSSSVSLPAGDVSVLLSDGRAHELTGAGSIYHLYELLYNPFTQTAQLYINGQLIFDNYAGDLQPSAEEVFFGHLSTVEFSDSCYNLVNFSSFDASADRDEDGLTESQELAAATNPLNPDTDADGFNDGTEIAQGSDPLDANSIPSLSIPYPYWGLVLLGAFLIFAPMVAKKVSHHQIR